MARWREGGGRVELPAWVRVFTPADWDEPDAQEQAMIGACPSMRPWPEHVHHWHAERRWLAAVGGYLDGHPAVADAYWAETMSWMGTG